MNNNLKVPSAASRLAQLPVVQSIYSTLSVLYTGTKCSNPNLKSVCEALESKVNGFHSVACSTVAPVIKKFEPQISSANDVACKTLDWLESSFPVLLSPTEEVAAAAKKKIHDIKDVVSIVAKGTVDCVQLSVTWVSRIDEANPSLVNRTVSVANVGLNSALSSLEAHSLPAIEENKETRLVERFEVSANSRCYPERIILLCIRLYKRTWDLVGTKIHSIQVKSLFTSTILVQPTYVKLVCSVQGLPHYLQHQFVSMLVFINQMSTSRGPPSRHEPTPGRSCPSYAADSPSLASHGTTPSLRTRTVKKFSFEIGNNGKGFAHR